MFVVDHDWLRRTRQHDTGGCAPEDRTVASDVADLRSAVRAGSSSFNLYGERFVALGERVPKGGHPDGADGPQDGRTCLRVPDAGRLLPGNDCIGSDRATRVDDGSDSGVF